MNVPLISVIMSVYNTNPDYLNEAIRSILDQSEKNFEFIIIDDASQEDIEYLIQSFNDKRIKFCRNDTNIGLTASLNKAIKKAKGKYIARMDADDISLPDRFKKQVTFLEINPKVGVLGTSAKAFGKTNNILKSPIEHDEIKAKTVIDSPMIHPSVMIRSQLLKENLYNENYRTGQDYELWSRLVWKTEFANLKDKLLKYRIHNSQVTFKKKKNQSDMANQIRVRMLNETFGNIPALETNLILKSLSMETLEKDEIIKLRNIYNILIERNMGNEKVSSKELIKVFSENLDRAIYISSRENRKIPLQRIKLKVKHPVNKYSIRKYLGVCYYPLKKVKKIISNN